MDNNLEIVDLYNSCDDNTINSFSNKLDSKLRVTTDLNKVDCDYEWLTMIEDTIMYIDNILRNPNRFIVNEEDIVKIELARRVTVESIKHLSRNTNLIQDYDKKTGDVKPSKILNINKEESFNTYENRFIYSLIQNMKMFIEQKKRSLILESSYKNKKKFEYSALTNVGKEKVNVSLVLDSAVDNTATIKNDLGQDIPTRIERVELRIADLCNTEVYKNIAKLHIALVTSPIKKTNVILKNVNFQYAVKLWNYLQTHTGEEGTTNEKKKADYYDEGKFKKYLDESFLLDYLVMDSIDADPTKKTFTDAQKTEVTERLVGNVVEKLIDINQEISEEKLQDIVSKQFTVIKYRNVVTDRKIQKIFKDSIEKYMKKIKKIDFRGVIDEEDEEDKGKVEED